MAKVNQGMDEQTSCKLAFRSAYSGQVRHVWTTDKPDMAKQSFKAECDINTIMARYKATGTVDYVNRAQPMYGEVSLLDYQECLEIVREAEDQFASLPAAVREKFYNDPGRFLQFTADPNNLGEMAALGLLSPEKTRELREAAKPKGDEKPSQPTT